MKAAVLFKTGDPLKIIDDIEIPELQKGQVLVKLRYSGVCHSQLMEVRGYRGEDRWLPHLLGHEGTGIVESVGEGVTRVKVGDKVILGWIKSTQGLSVQGARYFWNGTVINSGSVTTFSSHSIVSEDRCYILPEGIPMDVGVLFGCALPTGAGIVLNELKPKANSTLAILGLGGIGLSALLAAQMFELKRIIAIDISCSKLDLAKRMGATHTISISDMKFREAIAEVTDGAGVDFCVEAAGHVSTIEMAFSILNPKRGEMVFASHPKSGSRISLDPHELISGKKISGSWGGGFLPDRDIKRLADLCISKKEFFLAMIDRRYQLEEINRALNDLESRNVVRPLIEINE